MYIDVNSIIQSLVTIVGTALVAWLIAQITSWLKAKTEKERAEKQLNEITKYTEIANQTVVELVDYMNNTIVNEMKSLSDDGTLSEEESEQIKTACKCKLYGSLSDKSMEAMKTVYGNNVDSIFDMWIENAVSMAKANGTGIDSTTALGIAKMNSVAHDKRDAIKTKLTTRLENIVDTTSTC